MTDLRFCGNVAPQKISQKYCIAIKARSWRFLLSRI